ncbi:MAG: adenylyltransferase/cytidyltransferase family protein, partial [Ferruginibacter sp.]
MNVYTDIDSLPQFPNAVITTGSFDGVHAGHVQIIEQLIKEAKSVNGTPVIITFYPHPKHVVGPQQSSPKEPHLSSPKEREIAENPTEKSADEKNVKMDNKLVYILNTPQEKYDLLQSKGIENIVVVP